MKKTLVLALALAGFNAQAATVIALFNSEITTETVQRQIVNANTGWVTEDTGMFSFTRTGGTEPGGILAGNFDAFCIEPLESISNNNTYTYTLTTLDQGATNIGGMGAAKAALIDELFGRYYPVLGAAISAEQATALQIALWEIVRETSSTLNVYSGNVSFQNASDPAALILAQTYVTSLDGTGPKLNNLYALTNVGAQDVVVQIFAPEPATLATMGVALIAISLMLRRRRPVLVAVSKAGPRA